MASSISPHPSSRTLGLLLGYCLLLAAPVIGQQDYYTWSHFQRFTLNTTPSGADLTENLWNFPLVVKLSGDTFPFAQALPQGADLRFAKPDGVPLPFEIELWDSAAGRAVIWVKIDTVFANRSSQFFLMYWGNDTAVPLSDGGAVFDTADGFHGEYHLGDDPASGYIIDETRWARDGSPNGFFGLNPPLVEGVTGKALDFDGVGDYVSMTPAYDLANYTFSLWVKGVAPPRSNASPMKVISYGVETFEFDWDHSATDWYQAHEHKDGGAWIPGVNIQDSLQAGVWYHVAGTCDIRERMQIRIYLNGIAQDSADCFSTNPPITSLALGAEGSGFGFFPGTIDEVTIASVVRSDAWIKLQYENQRPGQKLVTAGAPGKVNAALHPDPMPAFSVARTGGGAVTVTLSEGGPHSVKVFGLDGGLLYAWDGAAAARYTLDAGLPTGIVLLRVTQGGQIWCEKILLE